MEQISLLNHNAVLPFCSMASIALILMFETIDADQTYPGPNGKRI